MVINSIYEFTPPPIGFPDRGRVKYPRQKLYVLRLQNSPVCYGMCYFTLQI